ncbi:hypothetical protein [Halorubrum sp. DTA46]|uniref:hypothetical protein n=1 Tax=Halorubrum sp. DTA46 TaxID=3402162 RepID=UPI003AACB51B
MPTLRSGKPLIFRNGDLEIRYSPAEIVTIYNNICSVMSLMRGIINIEGIYTFRRRIHVAIPDGDDTENDMTE